METQNKTINEIERGTELNCLRCENIWFSRDARLPKACPNCKSYLWDTKRINKEVKKDDERNRVRREDRSD